MHAINNHVLLNLLNLKWKPSKRVEDIEAENRFSSVMRISVHSNVR